MKLLALMALLITDSVWARDRKLQSSDLVQYDCTNAQNRERAVVRLKAQGVEADRRKVDNACSETQIADRRPPHSQDVTQQDCANEQSMAHARQKLAEGGVDIGGGSMGIRRLCGHSPSNLNPKEKITALVSDIKQNPSLCIDQRMRRRAALEYGLTYTLSTDICDRLKRILLQDFDFNKEENKSQRLSKIFEAEKVEKDVYVSGLRKRFVKALKPGIEADAPRPIELLPRPDGWLCKPNRPFIHRSNDIMTNPPGAFPLKFTVFNKRIEGGGFVYDTANGIELAGTDAKGEQKRSIRLEYNCVLDPLDCNESNSDGQTLIIEVAISKGDLLAKTQSFSWLKKLTSSDQKEVQNYVSKASPAINDYPSSINHDEIALNYFECFDDPFRALEQMLSNL